MSLENILKRTAPSILDPINIHNWSILAEEALVNPSRAAWAPRGIAWGDYKRVVMVQQDKRCELLGHADLVSGLDFSPNGQQLASASHDATVRLWDVSSCSNKVVLPSRSHMVFNVAFGPYGAHLASCGGEGAPIRLWDVASREELTQITAPGADSFQTVVFDRSGSRLFACDLSGRVFLWSLGDKKLLATGQHSDMVVDIALSSKENLIASASHDETVCLWDSNKLVQLHQFGIGEMAISVAFHPSENIVVAGDFDGQIHIWNTTTFEKLSTIEAHNDAITSVSFNPSGTLMASVGLDRVLRVWGIT